MRLRSCPVILKMFVLSESIYALLHREKLLKHTTYRSIIVNMSNSKSDKKFPRSIKIVEVYTEFFASSVAVSEELGCPLLLEYSFFWKPLYIVDVDQIHREFLRIQSFTIDYLALNPIVVGVKTAEDIV